MRSLPTRYSIAHLREVDMKTLWVHCLQRDFQSYLPFRFIRLNCFVMRTPLCMDSQNVSYLDPIEFQLGPIGYLRQGKLNLTCSAPNWCYQDSNIVVLNFIQVD